MIDSARLMLNDWQIHFQLISIHIKCNWLGVFMFIITKNIIQTFISQKKENIEGFYVYGRVDLRKVVVKLFLFTELL